MTDESFADLFGDKKIATRKLKPGDRITAVVAGVTGDTVFLDIGGKSEGVLRGYDPAAEEEPLREGDSIRVFFVGSRGGEMVFTTSMGAGQASLQEIEDAFHAGIPVQGRVEREIKGGFEVRVAGQRGFCPYSQMDIRRIEDPDEYLEKTLSFRVMEFTGSGRNIILSARAVIEEERREQRQQLEQTLEEGMRISGTVTSIRDFGAFVDIGGVDGLIPISELAWGQTDRVEDVLERGQQVEVVVKKLDWDRDRITLSLRETLENPWSRAEEKYPPGSIHQGTVSRLAAFGAFVTLEPGVDGLLHISKLGAGRRINHPREVLEPGQEITVKVDNLDSDQQRISLVPEDYQDTASSRRDEGERRKQTPARVTPQPRSMGTLGDLLQAQLKKKSG